INYLAVAYEKGGRMNEALAIYEENLKHRQAKLGKDHPDTLLSLNNLANGYETAGRLKDAVPLFEALFKLRKARFGLDHSDTLASMNILAGAYLDSKNWTEAEKIARECLDVREKNQLDDWRRFLTSSQLGAALAGQKRFDEAESLLVEGY